MSRKNKSYPAELKYQAVADYLSGAGSLRAICKKYKIGNKKRLQDWIKLYNSHKELKCHTGGSRMTKGRDTTYEERIAPVHECMHTPTISPISQNNTYVKERSKRADALSFCPQIVYNQHYKRAYNANSECLR